MLFSWSDYIPHCYIFRSKPGTCYATPFPDECSTKLDAFADSASNFTKCSILHARPIRICEKCIEQYLSFHNKYKELQTTEVNGTSCKSIYISCDRLDAILEYHDNILSIWDKGHCYGKLYVSSICIHLTLLRNGYH